MIAQKWNSQVENAMQKILHSLAIDVVLFFYPPSVSSLEGLDAFLALRSGTGFPEERAREGEGEGEGWSVAAMVGHKRSRGSSQWAEPESKRQGVCMRI